MIAARIEMPEGILPSDDLPDGWTLSTTGSISDVVGGGTPKSSELENFSEDGHPWITPADLSGFRELYIRRGRRDLSDKGLRSCSAVVMAEGTVLMSSRAPIGYVAIAANAVCTNQGFKSFVCHSGIDPEFVYFWLRLITPHLEQMGSGSTFTEISGSRAKGIPMLLAPAFEQRRIAAQIKRILPSIDSARDRLSRVQAILKRFRQAVLAAACSGRLTEDWRDRGTTDKSDANELMNEICARREEWLKRQMGDREAQRAQAKLLSHSLDRPSQHDLPERWVWSSLLEACWLVVDCHNKTAPYQKDGIPLVRTTNIKAGQLVLRDVKYVSQKTYHFWSRRCPPQPGDVLFTREAPMGECAVIPSGVKLCMGQRMMLLRVFQDLLSSEYLSVAIREPRFQRRLDNDAVGSGVKHLRVGDVERLAIPIPPVAEQQEIVRRAKALLSLADRVEARCSTGRKRADSLTESILLKAFRGELVPTEAELARREGREYEPASVLLERIKKERESQTSSKPERKRTRPRATLVSAKG